MMDPDVMMDGAVETIERVAAMRKRIAAIEVTDDRAAIRFADGAELILEDREWRCCERRYLICDDDLAFAKGEILISVEVVKASAAEEGENVHESAFVHVQTSGGRFTLQTHNVHNGHYDGILLDSEFRVAADAA